MLCQIDEKNAIQLFFLRRYIGGSNANCCEMSELGFKLPESTNVWDRY